MAIGSMMISLEDLPLKVFSTLLIKLYVAVVLLKILASADIGSRLLDGGAIIIIQFFKLNKITVVVGLTFVFRQKLTYSCQNCRTINCCWKFSI